MRNGSTSMIKPLIKVAVFIVFMSIISAGAGCSRKEQKMQSPDIKMITRENLHGVIAPDDNNIWITGGYGAIYHSSDSGKNWAKQNSGEKETTICDGVFLNASIGWMVGINGTILHTTDGGARWTRQNTGTKQHLFGISFVDEKHGWAVGEWGTIIHTSDGGATWSSQHKEMDKSFNNIFFVDTQNGWLVGERGTLLHTTDGGATWNPQTPKAFERASLEEQLENPPPSLFGVCFSDKNTGWACGIPGTIIKTTDGGTTWEVLPTGTKHTLYTIFIKYGKGWAVGDKGTYLMSNDGGNTWSLPEEAIKAKQPFRDVYFSSAQQGWVVGAGGLVVHTEDGGKTWQFRSGLSYAMKFFEMPKGLEFGGGIE